jgi:uncharacterized protein YwgA
MSFKIPWVRYSKLFQIITFFAENKEINKKQLNDLLFLTFIDEPRTEYDFSFYAHGIYSDQLELDLEMLENFHAISIVRDQSPKIQILDEPSFIHSSQEAFNQKEFEEKLLKIKDLTAGRDTKELELISSLFFIEKNEKNTELQKKLLKEIKPNISKELIETSFSWFTEIQEKLFSHFEPNQTASA